MTVLVIVLYSDIFALDFFVMYTWLPSLENWVLVSICEYLFDITWRHLIVLSGILKVFKQI